MSAGTKGTGHRCGALVAAVLVGVSGCSSTGPAQERADGHASKLPAFDINPAPRDRVLPGGTLRWPMPEFPTQWNFNQINGSKGVVGEVIQGALPHIVRADEKAVPHPVPDYLVSATVTRTKPKQVVTYTLNPKAAWSDGTSMSYRDFAAQAQALSGRDERFQVAAVTGYEQIEKVQQGKDERQAVVTFARPYADWMGLFSPLYPAATNTDPEVFNEGWLNRIPVTAGPFKFGGIDKISKTITIVRDPAWWGRPAKLDRIVYRVMDGSAMPGAFANGEVDVLDASNDANAYRRAQKVKDTVIHRAAGPDWRHFTFNAASPTLSDVRVRQAVMMGLNRLALTRSDLKDLDWPIQVLNNHFFMNTQEGYQDNAGELGRFDPERAGRLLDEAGWVRRGDRREKDGKPLTLRFVVPSSQPISKQEGELTQAMLKEIGVGVEIRPVPTDDLFDRYVTPGSYDLVPFSWLGTPFPASSNRATFAMPRGDSIQQNYSRVGSAALDEAMDKAVQELDPAKARDLINDADRMVWQLASVLPLYQRPQLIATRANLANFGARGFYDLAYEDIGFTGGS